MCWLASFNSDRLPCVTVKMRMPIIACYGRISSFTWSGKTRLRLLHRAGAILCMHITIFDLAGTARRRYAAVVQRLTDYDQVQKLPSGSLDWCSDWPRAKFRSSIITQSWCFDLWNSQFAIDFNFQCYHQHKVQTLGWQQNLTIFDIGLLQAQHLKSKYRDGFTSKHKYIQN